MKLPACEKWANELVNLVEEENSIGMRTVLTGRTRPSLG